MREVGQASKVPWTLKKGGAEKKRTARTDEPGAGHVRRSCPDSAIAWPPPQPQHPGRRLARARGHRPEQRTARFRGGPVASVTIAQAQRARRRAPLRRGRTCGTCRGGGGEGSVRATDCLHACLPGRHSNGQKAELSCPSASCHQTLLLLCFCPDLPVDVVDPACYRSATAHVRN